MLTEDDYDEAIRLDPEYAKAYYNREFLGTHVVLCRQLRSV